jgi:hypothetical protein
LAVRAKKIASVRCKGRDMRENERYENGLLTVRFIGPELNTRGVSIYDLSTTLLALQRIIHKAYLAQNDRLQKGAYPDKKERAILALQIGERRRASDAFALLSILNEPAVQATISRVIDWVGSALTSYYLTRVVQDIGSIKNPQQQNLISSIYPEALQLSQRIDAVGGVEAISLGSPGLGQEVVAVFDERNKDYISSLKGETALGTRQEIEGKVYKLYPASNIVAIRRGGGSTVNVFLNENDFHEIRYRQERSPRYSFNGWPRYKFGVETKAITEFEAGSIRYISKNEQEAEGE